MQEIFSYDLFLFRDISNSSVQRQSVGIVVEKNALIYRYQLDKNIWNNQVVSGFTGDRY